MTALREYLVIEAGASLGDGQARWDAYDLEDNPLDYSSGYTAEAIFCQRKGGPALLTLTQAAGITLADGYVEIKLTPTQTTNLLTAMEGQELGFWRLDIIRTSDSFRERLLAGAFEIGTD